MLQTTTHGKNFFSNLNNTHVQYANMQIILGGDLNCLLTPLDKAEITNHKLLHVWRSQHPNQSQFTWGNNSLKIQCRLDYWLVSKDLSSSLLSTTITSPTFSDHSAVSFVLQSKECAKHGPGFSKINNSLLKDDYFTAELAAKIPEYKAKHNYLADMDHYWDMLKMEERFLCSVFEKSKIRRSKQRELQKQIDNLMNVLKTNRSKENITQLYHLRAE